MSNAREAARQILRGRSPSVEEVLALAETLKKESAFSHARRLLARTHRQLDGTAVAAQTRLRLVQRLALCTYKDSDLPARDRLDHALDILTTHAQLDTSIHPETLGLAGAVHKRKWEIDAQRVHLERSAAYYLRGHAASTPGHADYDYGYNGINAAFVLDLLAHLEDQDAHRAGTTSSTSAARRDEAKAIRAALCQDLPGRLEASERQWWFYATLIEAAFGLGRYEDARSWIAAGKALANVADWEIESTARQLVALARVRDGDPRTADPAGWQLIEDLVGGDATALRRLQIGKIGLALSGGGFRASLFHIGVLARLAELDVLRNVEVLSCVSGGSIIGAHYYLEVRKLLRDKPDSDITQQHYIDIVHRIADEFLAGVQTNLRTSVTADLGAVLRMVAKRQYTRTARLGELYESRLFARVQDGEGAAPRFMDALKIAPDGDESFRPQWQNWRRGAKAPVLVLNAATLNTGHAWYFTATYMGEPGTRVDPRIDGNDWLRTLYYPEAPEAHRRIRLGEAVAASSCVPGLFEPVVLDGLYPDRVARLVDGGVYDNQGAAALIEQDCTVLLISDASGQMQTIADPPSGLLGVALRANSMLQARLRLSQFQEVDTLRRSSILRGVVFVHLKKGLDVEPVSWINFEDGYEPADDPRWAASRGPVLPYGIRRDVQAKLAAIRTDLDSFSDVEAYALMTSGYRMMEHEANRLLPDFPDDPNARERWAFLSVEPQMQAINGNEKEHQRLMQVLDAGSRIAFKLWAMSNPLPRLLQRPWFRRGLIAAAGAAFLAVVAYLVRSGWSSWGVLGMVAALAVAMPVLAFASRAGFFALGWAASIVHMQVFDAFYLRRGRVAPPPAPAPPAGPPATDKSKLRVA